MEAIVEACVTAGLIARNLGYVDLAHIAYLRANKAATQLGDPVQREKADSLGLLAFPRERSWERRLAAAETAADRLQPHARTPVGLQVLGMLTLHAALAAAVVQRPQSVSHWLAEAGQIARRVPDDMTGSWGSFCDTNVRLWTVAIGVERGESGKAVLGLAATVDQRRVARRNRRASFLADVGRGLAREPATRAEAIRWLRRAEETAPQLIRNSPPVRETVAHPLSRARTEAAGRELRGMAARMGVRH